MARCSSTSSLILARLWFDPSEKLRFVARCLQTILSYGPPWAHYIGGYQDRLLGGPLGLPGLRYTAPEGVEHMDNAGVVLG
jgi:hypothetical protein